MRMFVTGASGFLGSYLVSDLVDSGHEVAVLLRPGSPRWRLDDVLYRLTIIDGTLEDLPAFRAALADFKPEAVIHIAWRGVGNSERNNPMQARNIADAAELAALAADIGCTVFVGAGSQAEYGPYDRAISADDATHPTTLYGKAKLASAGIVRQIAEDRAMRFAWLRIFSTYGPKDAEYWLIPSFILTLSRGGKMSLTGCEQKWGFLHARDAASAFRIVTTSSQGEGYFNLGHPAAPILRDTLLKLRELVDPDGKVAFGDVPYRPDQVMILQADVQRLVALGWKPRVSLDDGLLETVRWYADSKRS
jgi:UDP-glucose 4-epimerase